MDTWVYLQGFRGWGSLSETMTEKGHILYEPQKLYYIGYPQIGHGLEGNGTDVGS